MRGENGEKYENRCVLWPPSSQNSFSLFLFIPLKVQGYIWDKKWAKTLFFLVQTWFRRGAPLSRRGGTEAFLPKPPEIWLSVENASSSTSGRILVTFWAEFAKSAFHNSCRAFSCLSNDTRIIQFGASITEIWSIYQNVADIITFQLRKL